MTVLDASTLILGFFFFFFHICDVAELAIIQNKV
jgi:hypothetical protein